MAAFLYQLSATAKGQANLTVIEAAPIMQTGSSWVFVFDTLNSEIKIRQKP